jgi:hypothetical protein
MFPWSCFKRQPIWNSVAMVAIHFVTARPGAPPSHQRERGGAKRLLAREDVETHAGIDNPGRSGHDTPWTISFTGQSQQN